MLGMNVHRSYPGSHADFWASLRKLSTLCLEFFNSPVSSDLSAGLSPPQKYTERFTQACPPAQLSTTDDPPPLQVGAEVPPPVLQTLKDGGVGAWGYSFAFLGPHPPTL